MPEAAMYRPRSIFAPVVGGGGRSLREMDVQLVLLRSLLGELPLKPGSVMAARVIDARTIALAGVRMAATLPEGIEPGTNMRVRVREAGSERLLLQIVGQHESSDPAPGAAAAPQPVPITALIPLPGGAT